MLIFVIPRRLTLAIALSLALVCFAPAFGEVIHLKNGDVIYADAVTEHGNSVTYEVGDNSFSIPKSQVQSIEGGNRSQAVPNISAMPVLTPDVPAATGPLLEKVIRDGQVDRSSLVSIESRGNNKEIAIAYYIAARTEFQTGKLADARRDFESGLRSDPENPALLNYYAALLLRTGNAPDAVRYAEKAVQYAPDSPDALAVLGYAQFASNHVRDAIQSWKKSLSLRPDASIQALVDRGQRESSAEKSFSQHQTGHFVLHYEGEQTSEAFRTQLVDALESDYQDLSREFQAEPHTAIQVILYTHQAFFDVTRAPSWTSALNDGKLRIPIDGLSSVNSDLARVLRHELAHSFVNQLSAARCPHWLNEGVAQVLEPRPLGRRLPQLAALFKDQHEVPINLLEGSFTSLNTLGAEMAYDESLAAVDYIRDNYGMASIVRILQMLGNGESAEAALRATIHNDYRQLEENVRAYLLRQAGN